MSEAKSCGIMIGIGVKVPWIPIQKITDPARQCILERKIRFPGGENSSVTSYVPNQQQLALGETPFSDDIVPCNHSEVITMGDFNAVMESKVEPALTNLPHQGSQSVFTDINIKICLV